jgi:hypothetical protein
MLLDLQSIPIDKLRLRTFLLTNHFFLFNFFQSPVPPESRICARLQHFLFFLPPPPEVFIKV